MRQQNKLFKRILLPRDKSVTVIPARTTIAMTKMETLSARSEPVISSIRYLHTLHLLCKLEPRTTSAVQFLDTSRPMQFTQLRRNFGAIMNPKSLTQQDQDGSNIRPKQDFELDDILEAFKLLEPRCITHNISISAYDLHLIPGLIRKN